MTAKKSLAIVTGLLLVMSVTLTTGLANALLTTSFTTNTLQVIDPNASFVGPIEDHGKVQTQLSMDPLPSSVFVGDDVEFSGKLMTADGEAIPQKSVKIYAQIPAPESVLLGSTVTGIDGSYEVVWNAKLPAFKHAPTSTLKQDASRTLSIYAEFSGDRELTYAKSNIQAVAVKMKDLVTTVKSDKTQYSAGETAIIFIGFVEADIDGRNVVYGDFNDFVDPTAINANFDGKAVELQKKKEGSYVFITPNLTKEHHQLSIMPQKEGYNAHGAFYTIIVEGLR